MSTGLRLGEYAVTPLYNIKAVVQATSISPSTLRAWERRYNIARPHRSNSGYRLYSERDITIIRWLKTQVEIGMSISQAVSWLGTLISEAGTMEFATLPTAGSGAPLYEVTGPSLHREVHRDDIRDFETIQKELIRALTSYDETAADLAIAEAFSIYPVEQVGDKLFVPLLQEVAERPHRGDLSITAERFAGNYLSQRLGSLLRSTPNGTTGSHIWVGSASNGRNDASAPLLSIYLRRAGYKVTYLGQNLSGDAEAIQDLVQETMRFQFDMLLLTASTRSAAEKIAQITAQFQHHKALPALVAFAGPFYERNPEWRAKTHGVYVGTYAKDVIDQVDRSLAEKRQNEKQSGKKNIHISEMITAGDRTSINEQPTVDRKSRRRN